MSLRLALCAGAAIALASPSGPAAQQLTVDVERAATNVEAVTVIARVPAPDVGEGAPHFAPEEIAQSVVVAQTRARNSRWARMDEREGIGSSGQGSLCRTVYETQDDVIRLGAVAEAATRAALAARTPGQDGSVDEARLVSTELARQEAVNAYLTARAEAERAQTRIVDLRQIANEGFDARLYPAEVERRTRMREMGVLAPPDEYDDLRLRNVAVRETSTNAGTVLVVSGEIINTRRGRIAIPPLAVGVIDRGGFLIKQQDFVADRRARIGPGEALPFRFEVTPSPPYSARASVTFGAYERYPKWLSPDCSGGQVRPARNNDRLTQWIMPAFDERSF